VECGSTAKAWDAVERVQAARRDIEALDFDSRGTLWVRIAGRSEAIDARVRALRGLLGGEVIPASDETRLWSDAGEFAWAFSTSSIVKVAGAALRRLDMPGTSCRYFCAGSAAWIAVEDPAMIERTLARVGLRGQVVRGERASTLLGSGGANPFEARVHQVLDPHQRFHAASDTDR
jgi:hypothetical protein